MFYNSVSLEETMQLIYRVVDDKEFQRVPTLSIRIMELHANEKRDSSLVTHSNLFLGYKSLERGKIIEKGIKGSEPHKGKKVYRRRNLETRTENFNSDQFWKGEVLSVLNMHEYLRVGEVAERIKIARNGCIKPYIVGIANALDVMVEGGEIDVNHLEPLAFSRSFEDVGGLIVPRKSYRLNTKRVELIVY